MHNWVHWEYQNDDQSISLILKEDLGITNFWIPDPGIKNSIPGLQSLLWSLQAKSCLLVGLTDYVAAAAAAADYQYKCSSLDRLRCRVAHWSWWQTRFLSCSYHLLPWSFAITVVTLFISILVTVVQFLLVMLLKVNLWNNFIINNRII